MTDAVTQETTDNLRGASTLLKGRVEMHRAMGLATSLSFTQDEVLAVAKTFDNTARLIESLTELSTRQGDALDRFEKMFHMKQKKSRWPRWLALLLGASLLSGCVALTNDPVADYLNARLTSAIVGQPVAVAIAAEHGLPDKAVQIGATQYLSWTRRAPDALGIVETCTETLTVSGQTVTSWHAVGSCQ